MPAPPAHCRIVVRDLLGMPSSKFLETLPLQMEVEEEGRQPTALIGHPIDLAAFLGVVHMLADLGFSVAAIEYKQDVPQRLAAEARLDDP